MFHEERDILCMEQTFHGNINDWETMWVRVSSTCNLLYITLLSEFVSHCYAALLLGHDVLLLLAACAVCIWSYYFKSGLIRFYCSSNIIIVRLGRLCPHILMNWLVGQLCQCLVVNINSCMRTWQKLWSVNCADDCKYKVNKSRR